MLGEEIRGRLFLVLRKRSGIAEDYMTYRMLKKIWPYWKITGLLMLLMVVAAPDTGQGQRVPKKRPVQYNQIKQVLVLDSYNLGYGWADSMNIKEVFEKTNLNVNVRYEFMDTKYVRPEEIFDQLRSLYKTKYGRYSFDVIIVTDNNAFNFLLRYREELCPGTPVVFCGVSDYFQDIFNGLDGVTGFTENIDLDGALDMMLTLHPAAKHVAVVSGTSISSRINQLKVESIMYKYDDQVEFIKLFDLYPRELKKRLETLPDDTIILYTPYFKMKDGSLLSVEESTSLVFKSSQLPIYSAWEYTLQGKGVVGGMMLSARREGERAAKYAVRILKGTSAQVLPIIYSNEIIPVFDFKMLEHFDISHDLLPYGSIIVNEPNTFYYRYKYWLWGIAIFICYQSFIILWMGQNLLRRKHAEKVQLQLEAQLLHSQKMEAIGTFAGGIAHDLNNILGAIGACSEMALEDLNKSSMAYEDLQHVINATNRGKSLIRQILDFSRKPTLEKKPINMNEMIWECVDLLEQVIPENVEIDIRITVDDAIVYANPAKVHQVLVNLCTNAEQAMRGDGGQLTIELHRLILEDKDRDRARNLKPGKYAHLRISDSGRGIPVEILPRIFDPFFTTRNQTDGTGLGLSVVHGIVTGYGGKIFVSSVAGEGSSFDIYLPCMNKKQMQTVTSSVPDEEKDYLMKG